MEQVNTPQQLPNQQTQSSEVSQGTNTTEESTIFQKPIFYLPILILVFAILFLILYPLFEKRILINDQTVRPGGKVVVQKIILNKPGFLTIEAPRGEGVTNIKVAGSELLTENVYQNFMLPIRTDEEAFIDGMDAFLQKNQTLIAILYEDSNGDGIQTDDDNVVMKNIFGQESRVTFEIK